VWTFLADTIVGHRAEIQLIRLRTLGEEAFDATLSQVKTVNKPVAIGSRADKLFSDPLVPVELQQYRLFLILIFFQKLNTQSCKTACLTIFNGRLLMIFFSRRQLA